MQGLRNPAGYRIVDEPRARFSWVVRPLFPLLALMVGGGWAGLPWFAFNAVAVGSPTRLREIMLAITGFVGAAVLFVVLTSIDRARDLSPSTVSYLLLALPLYKLCVGYTLFNWQQRPVALYIYFGGRVRNALVVIIAIACVRSWVVDAIVHNPLLWFLL